MVSKRLAISVRGKQHSWTFHFDGDPKHLQEWRDDGLEVVEIYYSIPEWIAGTPLTRVWMFLVDVFHFRNPFTP